MVDKGDISSKLLLYYNRLESYLLEKTADRYFMIYVVVGIILVYLSAFVNYYGFCKVEATTETISIFEPRQQPVTPPCKINSYFLLIFAVLMIFFVPGYAWATALFWEDEVDYIERFTISFALSISLVILTIIYLNLVLRIKITRGMVLTDIITITLLGVLYWGIRYDNWLRKKVVIKKPNNEGSLR